MAHVGEELAAQAVGLLGLLERDEAGDRRLVHARDQAVDRSRERGPLRGGRGDRRAGVVAEALAKVPQVPLALAGEQPYCGAAGEQAQRGGEPEQGDRRRRRAGHCDGHGDVAIAQDEGPGVVGGLSRGTCRGGQGSAVAGAGGGVQGCAGGLGDQAAEGLLLAGPGGADQAAGAAFGGALGVDAGLRLDPQLGHHQRRDRSGEEREGGGLAQSAAHRRRVAQRQGGLR